MRGETPVKQPASGVYKEYVAHKAEQLDKVAGAKRSANEAGVATIAGAGKSAKTSTPSAGNTKKKT